MCSCVYVNISDPAYWKKVLAFNRSPESLYNLAMQLETKGKLIEASKLYREAWEKYNCLTSKSRLDTINKQINSNNLEKLKRINWPLIIIISLFLIALAGWLTARYLVTHRPIINLVSIKEKGDEPDFAVSNINTRYIGIQVPYGIEKEELIKAMENQLKETLNSGGTAVQIYAVASKVDTAGILSNSWRPTRKTRVIGEGYYQPCNTYGGRIYTYFPNGRIIEDTEGVQQPYEALTLLRSALFRYASDNNNEFPLKLEHLIDSGYISYIPLESSSGSNNISIRYTAKGGWIYDPEPRTFTSLQDKVCQAIKINLPLDTPANKFIGDQFIPLEIQVSLYSRLLCLVSGEQVLRLYSVATGGKSSPTPQGSFKITKKVAFPNGNPDNPSPGYGTRALEFAPGYAIHGTVKDINDIHCTTLGCIAMNNGDIDELYSLTPLGSTVIISNDPISQPVKKFYEPCDRTYKPANSPLITNEMKPDIQFTWLN